MARPNPIRKLMADPLPNLTFQKRKLFRPGDDEINYAYNVLNRYLFDNQLKQPEITTGQPRSA